LAFYILHFGLASRASAAAIAIETEEFAQCFTTEDQKMAMNAFVKKEKIEKFNNR